jgi:hypothetical protein
VSVSASEVSVGPVRRSHERSSQGDDPPVGALKEVLTAARPGARGGDKHAGSAGASWSVTVTGIPWFGVSLGYRYTRHQRRVGVISEAGGRTVLPHENVNVSLGGQSIVAPNDALAVHLDQVIQPGSLRAGGTGAGIIGSHE